MKKNKLLFILILLLIANLVVMLTRQTKENTPVNNALEKKGPPRSLSNHAKRKEQKDTILKKISPTDDEDDNLDDDKNRPQDMGDVETSNFPGTKDVGMSSIESGDLASAEAYYTDLLQNQPNSEAAKLGLGIIDRLKGKSNDALLKFNEILLQDPNNADAKFNVAEMLTFERGTEGTTAEKLFAEQYYNEIISNDHTNIDAQNGLATVYLKTNRVDKAIETWEEMAKKNPDKSVIQSNLAEAYIESKHFDKALQISQDVIEKDPENSDAYFNISKIALSNGEQDKAYGWLQKALSIEPDNTEYKNYLNNFKKP